MATLATFFRRSDFISAVERTPANENARQVARKAAKAEALAEFKLRALPNDDVYFYCKRVDNSRLVRQADPQSKGQCWSAIGAACVIAAMAGTVMAPKVGARLAGYKIEQLRQEQDTLEQEIKGLRLHEATLLSPARLHEIADRQKLAKPAVGQVMHLEPKGDGAFAKVAAPSTSNVR
jgi:cell division protein FtsL